MPEKKINGRTLRTQTPYTSIPLDLLKSDKAVILETGEEVAITDTVLRVYVYMRNMYCLMSDSGNGYFEGWEGIASAIGKNIDVFKKGVNRPDKILEKIGLLEQKRGGKGRASLKIVYDITEVEGKVVFYNSKIEDYKTKVANQRSKWLSETKQTPVANNDSKHEYRHNNVIETDNNIENVFDFDEFDGVPF